MSVVTGLAQLGDEPLPVADEHEGAGRDALQPRHLPCSHLAMVARQGSRSPVNRLDNLAGQSSKSVKSAGVVYEVILR